MHGFPHLGQQKWLSFPAPFEELPALPLPAVGGSDGVFVPALHSQKLVAIALLCIFLIDVGIPLFNPVHYGWFKIYL